MDELGGVCSGAVALDQQVLVEVADPAAGLQPGVGWCVRHGRWGLRCPPMAVHIHQLVQRAAIRALSDWREVVSAGLLLPGHRTDRHRWRTSKNTMMSDRHGGETERYDSAEHFQKEMMSDFRT